MLSCFCDQVGCSWEEHLGDAVLQPLWDKGGVKRRDLGKPQEKFLEMSEVLPLYDIPDLEILAKTSGKLVEA